MPGPGYVWDEEYREKYYSSEKVKFHLELFREQAKAPKSEETKLKMSKAKVGKPKTEEQKAKMAETQKLRHKRFREVKEVHPNWDNKEVWAEVKRKSNE